MGSAISIFLIAAGAILYFAVSKTVEGLNLDAVGVILMIVGAGGLLVSLFMIGTARVRRGHTTVDVRAYEPVRDNVAVVHVGER